MVVSAVELPESAAMAVVGAAKCAALAANPAAAEMPEALMSSRRVMLAIRISLALLVSVPSALSEHDLDALGRRPPSFPAGVCRHRPHAFRVRAQLLMTVSLTWCFVSMHRERAGRVEYKRERRGERSDAWRGQMARAR